MINQESLPNVRVLIQAPLGARDGGGLQAEDLRAILQGMNVPPAEIGGGRAAGASSFAQIRGENFPLGNVIRAEDVSQVFQEPQVVDRLAEYVPETDR